MSEFQREIDRALLCMKEMPGHVAEFEDTATGISNVVRAYCKGEAAIDMKRGLRVAAIVFVVVVGVLLLLKASGTMVIAVGGMLSALGFVVVSPDARQYKPGIWLNRDGVVPDKMLGMFADTNDVPMWLKELLAIEVERNGQVTKSDLVLILDRLGSVVVDHRARRSSGAQRLLEYIGAAGEHRKS